MEKNKLKQAMAEIEDVLKKHDLCASMTLVSETHVEFRYHFGASWSVMYFEAPGFLRFRSKKQDFVTDEQQKKCVEASIGAICQIRDVSEINTSQMQEILGMLSKHYEIYHEPFKDFEQHTG